MLRCETPHRMWTVEGKIEEIAPEGALDPDLPRTHVGIADLSRLLAKHAGKWANIRVELIAGPRPLPYRSRTGKLIDYEPSTRAVVRSDGERSVVNDLKRMRTLATEIRERMATIRAARMPPGADRYVISAEEQCIDTLAETMLVVCDQVEDFDRRLQSVETGSAT
jgi:hypothetical protein